MAPRQSKPATRASGGVTRPSRPTNRTGSTASSMSTASIDLEQLAKLIAAATPKNDIKELASTFATALECSRRDLIDAFDGATDVEDWIVEFEKRGRAANYNEEALKRRLRTNLGGRALIWFQAAEHDEDWEAMSWGQLKRRFVDAFKPATYALDQRKAMNRQQMDNEDALTFFEKRHLAGKKLGWPEGEIVANIITTVKPSLYAKLSDKPIGSLDELRARLAKLCKQEALISYERGGGRKVEQHGRGQDRALGRRPSFTCWSCNEPGHRAFECPSRANTSSSAADKFGVGQGGRGQTGRNPYKWTRPAGEQTRMLPTANTVAIEAANKVELNQSYSCVVGVLIDGQNLEGLLDTGASRTCLDAGKFASLAKHPALIGQVKPIAIEVMAAGKHKLTCEGQVNLAIEVEATVVRIPTLIISGLGCDLILGRDFIMLAKISLIGRNGRIVCKIPGKRQRRKQSRRARPTVTFANREDVDASVRKFLAEYKRSSESCNENNGPSTAIENDNPLKRSLQSAETTVNKHSKQEESESLSPTDEARPQDASRADDTFPLDATQLDARIVETSTGTSRAADDTFPLDAPLLDAQQQSASGQLDEETTRVTDEMFSLDAPQLDAQQLDARTPIADDESQPSPLKDWHSMENLAEVSEPTLDYGGEWGACLELPDCGFADDPTEDYDNPYVLKEQTKPAVVGQGAIDVGRELTDLGVQSVVDILVPYAEILAFDGRLGNCSILQHEINTGEAWPINKAPYPRSQMHRKAVDNQVQLWLEQGVIQESSSSWASQIVTVQKKDNSIRCCVDYRPLNAVTERDVYPLPTREEIFASIEGKTYFSTIDLNQGYMQIHVRGRDVPKTAFKVQSGFYEFLRMPFGLTNAPATFQRLMDKILAELKWTACLVYLDDIIVFGRDLGEHNDNLARVLCKLRDANLTVKPSKCAFAVQQVKFLGHIISQHGVQMDPEKIEAIERASTPSNLQELRSFVGLASYYRGFVENFAKIAEPLTRLTVKNAKFIWTREQDDAFEELKSRLMSEPILCHFNNRLPVELRTDASNYAIGAILLHEFESHKRVIAYASRQLNSYERNYGITEKECLAVVWGVEKFRIYLQGIYFKVVTDHLALTWLQNKRDLNGRLMRWANKLAPFHFKIFYKSGKANKDADYLSRLSDSNIFKLDANLVEPVRELIETIKAAQECDTDCQEIVTGGHSKFRIENALIVIPDERDKRVDVVSKPLIPVQALPRIIDYIRNKVIDDMAGIRQTVKAFKSSFYTPDASNKIKQALKAHGDQVMVVHGRHGTHRASNSEQEPAEANGSHTHHVSISFSMEALKAAQRDDIHCREISHDLSGREGFRVQQGILMTTNGKIVVPESLFNKIMYALHDDKISGHCGYDKVVYKFNQRYYMAGARSKIRHYVKTCHLCQTRKQPWTRRYGLLQPIAPAHTPFQRVGIDTLGPFKRSGRGMVKIVVATDYMTRFAMAKAVPDETASTIAEFLIDEVFLKHGPPRLLLSDQGGTFATKVLKKVYEDFQVTHFMATPYHPQTNGLTERLNKTLSIMMSMYVHKEHRDWDAFLPFAVFAYNSQVQASTGYSPHYLLYGFEARQVTDLFDANPPREVAERYETMHEARELAREATERAQEKQKAQYDKHRHEQTFQQGDLVLVHRTRGYTGQSSKLRHPYEGPCVVVKKFGDLNYRVKFTNPEKTRRREEVVHVSRLKRYFARTSSTSDREASADEANEL